MFERAFELFTPTELRRFVVNSNLYFAKIDFMTAVCDIASCDPA